MFAVQYSDYGDASVLEIAGRPEPHAGPGSVRIRTLTASINPIDRPVRAGHLREMLPVPLPTVPGRDAAGIVDEVGEGVTDVAVGDKVFGLGGVSDTSAEYAVLTAWAPVPAAWSDEQAAAAGLASVTALRALDALGRLNGATLLVDGAAGAVGSAASAFAVASGARVIGTARPSNHEGLRAMGVTPVAYGDGLIERVRATAPDGIDLALDAAGSGSLPDLVELIGTPEHVVTVADHQRAGALGVRIVNAENDSSLLRRAVQFAETGRYLPRVSEIAPFTDAAGAHARSEHTSGKIVLRIGRNSRLASIPDFESPAGADGTEDDTDFRVATVRQLLAAMNARDLDALRDLVTDPLQANGSTLTFEQYLEALTDLYRRVPDFRYTITGLTRADGAVTISLLDTGTPAEPWLGHSADGSTFAATEHVTYSFADARISGLQVDLDTEAIQSAADRHQVDGTRRPTPKT